LPTGTPKPPPSSPTWSIECGRRGLKATRCAWLACLAHDRRLRSDSYDSQGPSVLECGGCEGRSNPPLHSRSVRCNELNFRSSTPTFGSTTRLQHIRGEHTAPFGRLHEPLPVPRRGSKIMGERSGLTDRRWRAFYCGGMGVGAAFHLACRFTCSKSIALAARNSHWIAKDLGRLRHLALKSPSPSGCTPNIL
jgi:hypothetical protein